MITVELIESLRTSIRGEMILPSNATYDSMRKVYNGMIDRHPAMIIRCKDAQDVFVCVNFARKNNLRLAVRGGGHNAAGLGVCDDGLVIDLSLINDIQVNAVDKTVRAGGGCLLRQLDAATHEVGMAVPLGILGTTGIAGLTLGGGLGYLTRRYGLTIDNLLEATVVVADGRLLTASPSQNPDLFWALRGGGGNFGVVVSFLYKLHPVNIIYGGPMLWHLEETRERMKWFRDFITNAPDDIYGFFALLTVPPVEPFPADLHLKKMCGIVWCYTGDPQQGEEVFKPIRANKAPALDFVGTMEYTTLQTMFDSLYPPGMQWYWKADFAYELPEEAIALHEKYGGEMPTVQSTMHLYPINGAAGRVSNEATPWNFRDAAWAQVIVGVEPDPLNRDKIIAWAKDYWNAVHPFAAGGAYINFMMEEGDERIRATYGTNYDRLSTIKAKYDPENLFRVNQNIGPKVTTSTAV